MKLAKSLLLGSAAAFVATTGYAADLPTKKAAPATYVKVCDAYGAGFFYIPGTDVCIKVGGRVRADYSMSGKQDVYGASYSWAQNSTVYTSTVTNTSGVITTNTAASVATTLSTPSTIVNGGNGLTSNSSTQNLYGWEARGRVDLDARSATAYGTVQTVASLRLARTTGVLDQTGPAQSASGAGATLEAAYIRFAGFTFGAAKDNFSFMPSTFYGAGHWSSFANGAKQLAYTAVLGGGFSATLALQDSADTTAGGVVVGSYVASAGTFQSQSGSSSLVLGTVNSPASAFPQVNGRIDFDQSWGSASVMGAVGQAVGNNPQGNIAQNKNIYAVGAGLKLNLPMIAAGDVLWLNAGYADGMTEYTTNWTSFKSSDTKRNVGGSSLNHPSWVVNYTGTGTTAEIQTMKSWNMAAVFSHYWAPQWRHSFLGTYGAIEGTSASKALAYGQAGAFGDATVWNVGTQLTFIPTKNFEIGVDVLYARVQQDVRSFNAAGISAGTNVTGSSANSSLNAALNAGLNASGGTSVARESKGNLTGRLRVERTF